MVSKSFDHYRECMINQISIARTDAAEQTHTTQVRMKEYYEQQAKNYSFRFGHRAWSFVLYGSDLFVLRKSNSWQFLGKQ